jgi:transposase-like protein
VSPVTESILSESHFHNEAAAIERLEGIVWPDGPVCPHCGGVDRITLVKGGRVGLKRCGDCKKQFTCKVGTVFESSHIPVHKWFQAAHLLASSKKGISSHQLHRTLKVTYKTAWFMSHRLREAMREDVIPPLGGSGKIVESDETYIGKLAGHAHVKGKDHKNIVLTLVERGGSARSFHIDGTTLNEVGRIVRENISRKSHLMTDEAMHYRSLGKEFAKHGSVVHSAYEYAKYEGGETISTNTVEGFYSIFKRGMKGIYQHCSEKHLHRYLAEFDFRYSNRVRLGVDDPARTTRALRGIIGKRLMYRDSSAAGTRGVV